MHYVGTEVVVMSHILFVLSQFLMMCLSRLHDPFSPMLNPISDIKELITVFYVIDLIGLFRQ